MTALPGTAARRRIYLMRHGFVDYTAREVVETQDPTRARLTEQGREEARMAGIALRDIKLDIAVSSGLLRTNQTAELVLGERREEMLLETDARFEELHSGQYIHFESAEQLAEMMSEQFDRAGDPGATFLPGGERFTDADQRIREGLQALLARKDWSTALLVAHEGVNRLILASILNGSLQASTGFEQDTGCINILDFDLAPVQAGEQDQRIARAVIKAMNLTPANYLKNGMNLRSFEAIFIRS
jgi:probable phosphoglycerate mutase